MNTRSSVQRYILASALILAMSAILPWKSALALGEHSGHGMTSLSSHDHHAENSGRIDRTITLRATEIAFDQTKVTVKKGETIRFILVNDGEQDHELTIGDEKAQQQHQEMMRTISTAAQGGDMHDHGHSNSISAKPGERKELIWSFPETGRFLFACNYPGHTEAGMAGVITVQ